jgi:integrase
MVKVDLRGVHHVTIERRGRTYEYWYAWRGGPKLRGDPSSPEFIASYNEAIEALRAPDASRFRSLLTSYKASNDFTGLAESTRGKWAPWLDKIGEHFGELSVRQFDRADKIRPVIRRWRSKWEDTPRTADYAIQVLSAVLSHGVEQGRIAGNPCEGIKRLYDADRSEIIWTDADILDFKATLTDKGKPACSPEMSWAVDLAAHTGLRLGDLILLSRTHVRRGEGAIVIATNKSGKRREAIIPLYDGLLAVLDTVPKRAATTILTSARGRPWTQSGLSSAVQRVKVAAGWDEDGVAPRDLHFHDLRGTAATKFYTAGIPIRAIAEIMGWEESTVEKIIRRYVGRQAATKALIEQLNKSGK